MPLKANKRLEIIQHNRYLNLLTIRKCQSLGIKKTKYYRILGKVIVDGNDANYEQLKKGLAWYYKQYEKDLSDDDKKRYSEAEEWARNYAEGLWADSNSMPPWEFRQKVKIND